MIRKLALAISCSPLPVLPVLFYWFILVSLLQEPHFIDLQLAIFGPIVAMLISYPFVIVLGAPTYLLLNRFGMHTHLAHGMAGATLGLAVIAYFWLSLDIKEIPVLYGISAALSGGTVGAAFSYIANNT